MMIGRYFGAIAILVLLVGAASPGSALLYAGDHLKHFAISSDPYYATADFYYDTAGGNNDLYLVLTNAATTTDSHEQLLGAFLWSTPTWAGVTLTDQWAKVGTGAAGDPSRTVYALPIDQWGTVAGYGPGADVSAEYGYKAFGGSGFPAGGFSANYGVGAIAYDGGGSDPNISADFGPDGQDIVETTLNPLFINKTQNDGANWSLVGTDNTPNYNSIQSDNPYIQSTITCKWTVGGTIPNMDDANGFFSYGTTWGPGYSTVPEPASCALLALAVGGIGAALKRRRSK